MKSYEVIENRKKIGLLRSKVEHPEYPPEKPLSQKLDAIMTKKFSRQKL
jgi:hypothetical protein